MAHFKGDPANDEYAGRVTKVRSNGTLDVEYDDGDKDERIPPSSARLIGSSGRGSRNDPLSQDDDLETEELAANDRTSRRNSAQLGNHRQPKSLTDRLAEEMREASNGDGTKLFKGAAVKVNYQGGKTLYAGVVARVRKDASYRLSVNAYERPLSSKFFDVQSVYR